VGEPRVTFRLTRDQVLSARALAQLRGGVEHLSPILQKVAAVALPEPDPGHASIDAIESARALIALRGGPEHVSDLIRRLAVAQPAS